MRAVHKLRASLLSVILSAFAMTAGVADDSAQTADFLFVQTAQSVSFNESSNELTLVGVSNTTLFFTDRPERIAGNMTTESFIPFWNTGQDSFLSDPPNADVSLLEGNKLTQVVVELQDPALNGDNLTYKIDIIQGEMPVTAANASVFIDFIGMPLTPVSYAGVARRTFRRAAIY
jgi:hypothetical protein